VRIFRKCFFIYLSAMLLFAFSLPVFSFDLIVPDTGQDLCYDWERIICDEWHMEGLYQVCDTPPYCPEEGEYFYGQDACYTIHPPDLTDNGDGTVIDNLTGLMWEQKTAANEPDTYTYSGAINYCEELTLGGHSDWRVPTRKEFSTILNYGTVSPALDTDYFPYYTTSSLDYWTVSEYHDNSAKVWKIQISFGLIYEDFKTSDPPVLSKVSCVRGDTEPTASYIDNGDSTVTDIVTGLMWEQKTDDGGSRDKDITYTWKDALAYCENLLLGGYSDWRLPNPKELERLVDLGASSPAVDTMYFPNTNNGLYWTGTTCSGCHKKVAFAMDFTDGVLFKGNKVKNDVYDTHYVRAVRNEEPDLILLSSFTATPSSSKVILQWSTESEINNSGFNIYRAQSEKGEYFKINDAHIPTKGSPTEGASYEFIDEDVKNRTKYWYMLEDVDLNGVSIIHWPASAKPRLIYGIIKN
jgi:hypothetical protein